MLTETKGMLSLSIHTFFCDQVEGWEFEISGSLDSLSPSEEDWHMGSSLNQGPFSGNGTTWIPQFHDFSSIPPY